MSGSGETRKVLESNAKRDTHPSYVLATIEYAEQQQQVILQHAHWDRSDSRFITAWLQRASVFEEFAEVVAARLAANPSDVPALRAQQDVTNRHESPQLFASHIELAQQHPDHPDLQYIGTRALPDGPQQDAAFLQLAVQWPDHCWINFAAGYALSRQAQWPAALEHFQQAARTPGPTYESAAVQVARIRRLLSGDGPVDLHDLHSAVELQQFLLFETGQAMQGTPEYAFFLLHGGQLQQAYRVAGGDQADPHALILLAASEGADRSWQQQALQLPLDQIQRPEQLLYLAVLADRAGQPYQRYLQQFDQLFADEDPSPGKLVRDFLERDTPPALTDQDLAGLDPYRRGIVLAAAIVRWPHRIDPAIKLKANRLLFSLERPAF